MKQGPIAATLLAIAVLLAGCGQKGPLYLPGEVDKAQIEIPPQDETAGAEDTTDDDPRQDEPR